VKANVQRCSKYTVWVRSQQLAVEQAGSTYSRLSAILFVPQVSPVAGGVLPTRHDATRLG
jgi:hypothetical protein